MTLVQDRDGLESAREIANPAWMIGSAMSSTFHGRDIFSPAGAHLARGDDWTQVGPELNVAKLVRLDITPAKLDDRGLSAQVIATDGPFGNLVTNISGEDFLKLGYTRGQTVSLTIGATELKLPFVRTFSDVPLHTPLLYIDSRGHVGFAVNQGSFASIYRIKPPQPIISNEDAIPSHSLNDDPSLQVKCLLPDEMKFDFAVNTMVYQPGAALSLVEMHVMEHGLLMLEGGGIYRLGDSRYPVTAGDFIWMGPWCPQWFGAIGKVPAKYLIYKDWNRHPLAEK